MSIAHSKSGSTPSRSGSQSYQCRPANPTVKPAGPKIPPKRPSPRIHPNPTSGPIPAPSAGRVSGRGRTGVVKVKFRKQLSYGTRETCEKQSKAGTSDGLIISRSAQWNGKLASPAGPKYGNLLILGGLAGPGWWGRLPAGRVASNLGHFMRERGHCLRGLNFGNRLEISWSDC